MKNIVPVQKLSKPWGILCPLALLLSACAGEVSVSQFTRFGIRSAQDSSIVLHQINASFTPTQYLGALRLQGTAADYVSSGRPQLQLPTSISSQLSSDAGLSRPITHTISQVQNAGAGRSWFWRAPLTHPQAIELDSITTVAFEMMTILASQGLWNGQISRQSWEAVYASAYRDCGACSLETVPNVATKLISSQTFLDQLAAVLATPPLSDANFASQQTRPVYWYPGNLAATVTEGSTLQVFSYFWSLSSTAPLSQSWARNGVPSANSTASFTWQVPYDAQGQHSIVAEKVIGIDTVRRDFAITVSNVNQDPVWTTAPINQRANTVLDIDLAALVSDPDNDDLSFELSLAPAGAVISGSTLTLSPVNADVGTKTLTIYVDDGEGSRIPASVPWTIAADTLPSFGASPTTWALTEGSSGQLVLSATDADGDTFIIECLSSCPVAFATPTPGGANTMSNTTLAPGQHRFTLTPDYQEVLTAASRVAPMRFRSKYTGLSMNTSVGTEFSVSVNITNADDPPQWSPVPNLTDAVENTPYSRSLSAIDPSPVSPGSLSYACPRKPGWMTVNASTGAVGGTPPFSAATGEFVEIICTVTDSRNMKIEWSGTISVVNVNRNPTISTSLPDPLLDGGANAREGVLFEYDLSLHFTDPDLVAGDPLETLSYTCQGCPSGMSISSGGIVSWTPGYSQSGTYTNLVFTARDREGLFFTHSAVSVIVENREGPPLVTLSPATIDVDEMSLGAINVDVDHSAGDSYDYNISYQCTPACPGSMVDLPDTTGIVGDASKTFNISPGYDDGNAVHPTAFKTYNIAFTVSKVGDPSLSTTRTLTLRVMNTNRAPTDILFNGIPSSGSVHTANNNGFTPVTNTVYLAPVDADGTNDKYTFSVNAGRGQIVGSGASLRWEFNPNTYGCWPGGQTADVTATITMNDGRGGIVTRDIRMLVTQTSPRGAPCPY